MRRVGHANDEAYAVEFMHAGAREPAFHHRNANPASQPPANLFPSLLLRSRHETNGEAEWQPGIEGIPAAGRELQYVLRAYDEQGKFDETSPRPLWLVNANADGSTADVPATATAEGAPPLAGYGESHIALRNIRIGANTVAVRGSGIPEGHTVWVAGRPVPVDAKGDFISEEILPDGLHTVEVAVLDAEGIAADDDALTLIARHADGGMRDALSVLDQCLSLGEGAVTAARVRDVLGLVADDLFAETLDLVAERNPAAVFPLIDHTADTSTSTSTPSHWHASTAPGRPSRSVFPRSPPSMTASRWYSSAIGLQPPIACSSTLASFIARWSGRTSWRASCTDVGIGGAGGTVSPASWTT